MLRSERMERVLRMTANLVAAFNDCECCEPCNFYWIAGLCSCPTGPQPTGPTVSVICSQFDGSSNVAFFYNGLCYSMTTQQSPVPIGDVVDLTTVPVYVGPTACTQANNAHGCCSTTCPNATTIQQCQMAYLVTLAGVEACWTIGSGPCPSENVPSGFSTVVTRTLPTEGVWSKPLGAAGCGLGPGPIISGVSTFYWCQADLTCTTFGGNPVWRARACMQLMRSDNLASMAAYGFSGIKSPQGACNPIGGYTFAPIGGVCSGSATAHTCGSPCAPEPCFLGGQNFCGGSITVS